MEMVKEYGQKIVQYLRAMVEKGHRIDQSSSELKEKNYTNFKQQAECSLSLLTLSLEVFFSKFINCNMLEDYQPFSILPNYHLHKFQPGPTSQIFK